MFHTRQTIEKAEIREAALSFGADLAGVVALNRLEMNAPADSMRSLVVFGKRALRGVVWSRHLPTKQLAGGRTLRVLDRIADRLASFLETKGYPSLPAPSGIFDFERRVPEDVTPAGQGSRLLRQAAVEAGLGTWGLNNMVLTPQYGPRIYFCGVMTELEGESDHPLEEELCLGLEQCGRCAAICPEDAIPRRAPIGADLHAVRALDSAACCRSSQPFGFGAFIQHAENLLQTLDSSEMFGRMVDMKGRRTGEVWSEMAIMKEGSITGCSQCTQVCPVGADYEAIRKSPHRQQDLPEILPRQFADGFVQIENLGPTSRRSGWRR